MRANLATAGGAARGCECVSVGVVRRRKGSWGLGEAGLALPRGAWLALPRGAWPALPPGASSRPNRPGTWPAGLANPITNGSCVVDEPFSILSPRSPPSPRCGGAQHRTKAGNLPAPAMRNAIRARSAASRVAGKRAPRTIGSAKTSRSRLSKATGPRSFRGAMGWRRRRRTLRPRAMRRSLPVVPLDCGFATNRASRNRSWSVASSRSSRPRRTRSEDYEAAGEVTITRG